MEFGLIGEHLQHSFSEEIHSRIGKYGYQLKELGPNELEAFLKKKDFRGLNVTIPYKQAVIPFLDALSPEARRIGAVNTIVNRNGKLTGYNTDYYGFASQLRHLGVDPSNKRALILGRGGAAKAVEAVLMDAGATGIVKCGRDTDLSEGSIGRDFQLLINATPVGMYRHSDSSILVDPGEFSHLKGVVDCIYNPLRTLLVNEAQLHGIPAEGGLYMLVAQAIKTSELFLGESIKKSDEFSNEFSNQELTDKIYDDIISDKQNLVLIGMPSCGKSTLGRRMAEEGGRRFIDTDIMVEEIAGKSIPAIFASDGEEYFRSLETDVISSISTLQGCVIATGGGAVLNPENMSNLRKNGKIIYLQAKLEDLKPGSDRPLSKDMDTIKRMYAQRHPLYMMYADTVI